MTAPDGSYSLSDLGDGTYLLTVSAPGYASVSRQVSVTSGSVVPVEVRLQPRPGSLAGTVTSATTGAPVAGATVVLGQWSTETDAEGRYSFPELPPGAYTLQVSLASYQAYQASATIGPGASVAFNAALTPSPGSVVVKVVDAASGSPIGGATISYGATATTSSPSADATAGNGAGNEAPCPDVKLLVPLKRSPEFAAIRRRVADPHHRDAWVEDGLHFFVFELKAAAGAEAGAAPVAVFTMRPEQAAPVAAVVVTPSPDGAEAEIRDLREPDSTYTAPVA